MLISLAFFKKKSTNKTEKIEECCLTLLYNNTTETYDDLLVKTVQPSMKIKRLRTLATKTFKTLNDTNGLYPFLSTVLSYYFCQFFKSIIVYIFNSRINKVIVIIIIIIHIINKHRCKEVAFADDLTVAGDIK